MNINTVGALCDSNMVMKFTVSEGRPMSDGEKKSSGNEGRLLLVLGVLAFCVAVALILLAASALRASSVPTNHPQAPRGQEKAGPSKP